MANNNYQKTVKRLGIPDEFINHGTQKELHYDCNYDDYSNYNGKYYSFE